MDVSVIIGTFGNQEEWSPLAQRAIESAFKAGPKRIFWEHKETLDAARNAGLDKADTEWVVHLDADDELDPGFFKAMERGTADIRGPAVQYIRGTTPARPMVPHVYGHTHQCVGDCLKFGNWLVVGSLVRTELAQRIRWKDWPIYEDFDFWQRCWLQGATIESIPDAIYKAHVRHNSRNRQPNHKFRNEIHEQINLANLGVRVVHRS